ncbi:histidine ammonia-lyase [Natronospira sp.]
MNTELQPVTVPISTSSTPIVLDGRLTLSLFRRIIEEDAPLQLSTDSLQQVERCHDFLLQLVADKRRIYGVTTGYGPLATSYIDPAHSGELQKNLVRHLSSGTGRPLPAHQVRAIMLARLNALLQGHSAVSTDVCERLAQCLNVGFLPRIPERGTVGASGDLTPLAHLAGALMGEGRARLGDGPEQAASRILAELGWAPLEPDGKNALGLVNGTSAMTGIGALTAIRAQRALEWTATLGVSYAEVLKGKLEAFDSSLAQVRGHGGQARIHHWLLELARGSQRLEAAVDLPPVLDHQSIGVNRDQPLPQDPYSIRCLPQILGAVDEVVRDHARVVENELNAVTDNPIFFPDEGKVVHGGNFYGQPIAFASDSLAQALIKMAVLSERRIARITDPGLNGDLPAFLQGRETGLHSGFMGAQVTASATVAEMRQMATPASIQSVPTNANNQDVVPMGTIGARRTDHLADLLFDVLAIEAMVLAQAVDLSGKHGFAHATRKWTDWLRDDIPFLNQDRALSDEIIALAGKMSSSDVPLSLPKDQEEH